MRIDEKWLRERLPRELSDQPIDCFKCEYLDGLTVMKEGERGGSDGVEEPRAGSVIKIID